MICHFNQQYTTNFFPHDAWFRIRLHNCNSFYEKNSSADRIKFQEPLGFYSEPINCLYKM